MNKKQFDPYDNAWKNIKSLDDVITEDEKKIIKKLQNKIENLDIKTCPYLRLDGKYFYYCRAGFDKIIEKNKDSNVEEIGPFNPKYINHIDICFLQLFCMNDFENCADYVNYLKNKKEEK